MRHARTSSIGAFALVVTVALAVAGCSSFKKATDGWFGPKSSSAAPDSSVSPETSTSQGRQVFYSNADGLKVYSAPSSASKVIGVLSLHEKVTRAKVDHGYAYVESAETGLKGWANNAQLLWRLPATSGAVPAREGAPAQPAGGEPQAPAPPETTETTTVTEPPTTTSTVPTAPSDSGTPSPSILDSY